MNQRATTSAAPSLGSSWLANRKLYSTYRFATSTPSSANPRSTSSVATRSRGATGVSSPTPRDYRVRDAHATKLVSPAARGLISGRRLRRRPEDQIHERLAEVRERGPRVH